MVNSDMIIEDGRNELSPEMNELGQEITNNIMDLFEKVLGKEKWFIATINLLGSADEYKQLVFNIGIMNGKIKEYVEFNVLLDYQDFSNVSTEVLIKHLRLSINSRFILNKIDLFRDSLFKDKDIMGKLEMYAFNLFNNGIVS